MKSLAILAALLLCSACATHDEMAKGDVYHPPQYRTGSNLPTQGGSREPEGGTVDATDIRNTIGPRVVPRGN